MWQADVEETTLPERASETPKRKELGDEPNVKKVTFGQEPALALSRSSLLYYLGKTSQAQEEITD